MTFLVRLMFMMLGGTLCFGQPFGRDLEVDSYLRGKNFQGTVLIAKQGKILFSKGYGLSNAEHQIPNTSKTVFRLGSITKQFTAVAILQLQEQGKLNVKNPISTYLPDYPQGDKITIHQLLTHTSGILSITKFPNLSEIERQPSTPDLVMTYFKDLPLEFAPGTECKYSDSGYIVLGAILEAVTATPYEKYVQEHFFSPLGMKTTYFDHNQSIIPNRASGYGLDTKGMAVNAEFIEMSFPHAAGSLASTVEDLYIWDRALKGDKLLSKESKKQLFRVQAFSENNQISYGYGLFIDDKNHIVGHMGSIEGFRAALYRHLNDDVTLIILSNRENTQVVALEQELFFIISSSWRS
jgi:CubicO group peptidase (beta-lactamase class C family)